MTEPFQDSLTPCGKRAPVKQSDISLVYYIKILVGFMSFKVLKSPLNTSLIKLIAVKGAVSSKMKIAFSSCDVLLRSLPYPAG
ncbi:hypothetical protein CGZ90_10160 [Fictibacillus aquaticus]|uniref:Uncharacterized protein n=1 Tax=Fictibacillus aquaticus TaxID=2021314 RepID=A0A235FBT0_9BACL|nr:hypothetical protein CGZ90_10160 [Fictibacillus aquaticus]